MSDKDNNKEEDKLLYCSFCGKNQNEVRKLIAGPSVYICNECIDLCNDIIKEEISEATESEEESFPVPIDQRERCFVSHRVRATQQNKAVHAFVHDYGFETSGQYCQANCPPSDEVQVEGLVRQQ